MPIVVDVVSKEDYAAWVESKQAEKVAELASATKEWTEADLVARGEEVYNANCSGCHQKDGSGIPGVFPAMIGSEVTKWPCGLSDKYGFKRLKGYASIQDA
jgi:cytochrome c oxidase subunit 2